MSSQQLDEVQRNYRAFTSKLPSLLPAYRGKFALMRDAEVIEFFDTARDAYAAGRKLYPEDMRFSIQEVTDAPVDLGIFSHAVPIR